MSGEKLFSIIGLVDDGLIEEAEDGRPARKKMKKIRMKWAAAACVVIVIGSGIWYIGRHGILPPSSGSGGSGHAEGSSFMHYAGPILPLNAAGNTDGITASRSIDFDFAASVTGQNNLLITDTYTLTNNTAADKTIDTFYPFISSITESARFTPKLAADGKVLKTELLIGDYSGGFTGVYGAGGPGNSTYNLAHINSWEGYKVLLENGKYFETARGEKTSSDQKVTVYTFHDVAYPEGYDAATLAIEFDLPQGSSVITYGINGASFGEGNHRIYDYFVRHSSGQRIIFLGEPPAKYKVQGYENGACEKKVDGIKASVKKEEMLLSEVIHDCMADHMEKYITSDGISPLVTEEHLFRAVVSMFEYTSLGNEPKDRYDWIRLDDLIGESCVMDRIMYLKAQVTIPAGQSIEFESKFEKGASYDFAGAGSKENQGVKGYDIMTKLGSNLKFSGQRAGINLPQTYEIVRQNFGFDPSNGVTEVSLDMAQERYYLEIKAKSAAAR
ncbi:MAG TPA: hypothetical protein VHT34_00445 [Clostridia bacterium]|nr:hypothetical protein [Clostridia bacterium]